MSSLRRFLLVLCVPALSASSCFEREKLPATHAAAPDLAAATALRAQLRMSDSISQAADSLESRTRAREATHMLDFPRDSVVSRWSGVVEARRQAVVVANITLLGANVAYSEVSAAQARPNAAMATMRLDGILAEALQGYQIADDELVNAEIVLRNAELGFGSALRTFAWPPPRWTSSHVLSDSLVGLARNATVGSVFDRLEAALTRAHIGDHAYYKTKGGFAVIARMETIENDGRPKTGGARWTISLRELPSAFSDLHAYLDALLHGKPGRYRVIVLAVTTEPLEPTNTSLRADDARSLSAGAPAPSRTERAQSLRDRQAYALIYEFDRAFESDTVRFVESSSVSTIDHLVRAGLWSRSELEK